MLKRVSKAGTASSGLRVAVVASEYNRRHVDGLLDGALRVLKEADVEVEVVRVPGAFEIPVTIEAVIRAREPKPSAVLALGVIIRGETAHADLVGEAVTRALMECSVRHGIPVIHEVLLVASQKQAEVRCLDPRYNRGGEAATTALSMARALARVRGQGGRR